MFYEFMLITQKNDIPDNTYLDFIKQCLDGGVTSIQLREKHLDFSQLKKLGEQLLKVLDSYKVPLIINDFPTLAKELNTPYIHVGQKDESIKNSLAMIPNANIGISIESIEQLYSANNIENLAYVTASAVFPSTNKSNLNTIWGLDGIKQLSTISKHPLTAIGGITLENCEEVIQAGAKGIALIGAIHDSPTPYKTCNQFKNILYQNLSL